MAADKFCTLPWATVEELYFGERGHSYTYPSQLPHRCLEALYIVTLLEKGFGFDPDGRSITLALEVPIPRRIDYLPKFCIVANIFGQTFLLWFLLGGR